MLDYIRTKKPDDMVKFTVKRDGKDVPLDLVLGVGRRTSRPPSRRPAAAAAEGKVVAAAAAEGAAGPVAQQANSRPHARVHPDRRLRRPGEGRQGPGRRTGRESRRQAGMDVVARSTASPIEDFRGLLTELRVAPREEDPRKAGDKVKITFKQGGKETELELALAETELQLPFGGGGGGGRGANAARPNGMGLGGQQPTCRKARARTASRPAASTSRNDGGETWTRVNSLNPRPCTSARSASTRATTSTSTSSASPAAWQRRLYRRRRQDVRARAGRGVHADQHALWIDPKDGRHMLVGCDGGFYATYDRGENWDHLNHVAIGQFYHVAVDTSGRTASTAACRTTAAGAARA